MMKAKYNLYTQIKYNYDVSVRYVSPYILWLLSTSKNSQWTAKIVQLWTLLVMRALLHDTTQYMASRYV